MRGKSGSMYTNPKKLTLPGKKIDNRKKVINQAVWVAVFFGSFFFIFFRSAKPPPGPGSLDTFSLGLAEKGGEEGGCFFQVLFSPVFIFSGTVIMRFTSPKYYTPFFFMQLCESPYVAMFETDLS